MSTKRQNMGKRVRFEVFKRDGFKCQYCGATAPDVVLEVDHINPVSKGGDNELINLITSCKSCNSGKSDIPLSDDASVKKQRAMLDELSDRREQLEMMLAWRDGLKKIGDDTVSIAEEAWQEHVPGWSLNDAGMRQLKLLLRKASLEHVLEAIDLAAERHLARDENGVLTVDSVNLAWSKVGGIARTLALPDLDRQLLYIRGICRNRFTYCNEQRCLDLLREAALAGVDIDTMTAIAKEERNWSGWQAAMNTAIDEVK